VVPLADITAGYGWLLAETLVALIAVCLLALVALRWGLRRLGMPGSASGGGRIRVLERVAIDPRRSLLLVAVGARVLLVGSGEGPITMLAEIDPATLPPLPERRTVAFKDILARALGRRAPEGPPPAA
jgi:flagellar protein FliO/FliZ